MKLLNTLCATVGAAGALAMVAGCAPSATPDTTTALASNTAAQECFYADQVRAYSTSERTTILLDTGRGRTFKADSAGICQDMDYASSITIRPESSGTSRLCPGDHARLTVRSTMGSGPCRVRVDRLVTPEEKAALEKKTS